MLFLVLLRRMLPPIDPLFYFTKIIRLDDLTKLKIVSHGFPILFFKDCPGLGNMEALGLDLFSPTFDFLYTAI